MTVAAVVVTYNRVELLEECLKALMRQTHALDEIIVVDNGSTDDTPARVRACCPDAVLISTGANLGGAGGFAAGLDGALSAGHTSAWLMDDDALPSADALAPLLRVLDAEPDTAFVASRVLDPQGRPLEDHAAVSAAGAPSRCIGGEQVQPSDHATFVGVLVNLVVARRTALPFVDFFLWFDDNEYTRRLGRLGAGYYAEKSRITHPRKQRTRDVGDRIYYAVRNSIWMARTPEARSDGLGAAYLRDASLAAAAQLIYGTHRARSSRSIGRALVHGVARRPRVTPIGSTVGAHRDAATA